MHSVITRIRIVVALGMLAVSHTAAQAEENTPRRQVSLEPVVVTATRTTLSLEAPAASASVLDEHSVRASADIAVDDILKTIPGFSLYRRSSSMVTPPDLDSEAQGVTLRNIGPAGASRALVMVDGVPLLSGFDGQPFWGKVPKDSIDHIEVVRGSGASLWGNYAMAGVINIITRKPTDTGAQLKGTYGTDGLTDDYLEVTGHQDRTTINLAGNFFNLDGFKIVQKSQRGPIDGDASSRDEVFNGRVGYQLTDDATVSLHGQYFNNAYNYGTNLRKANTDAGLIDLGGTLHTDDGSDWQAMLFSNMQTYEIDFTEVNEERTEEERSLHQKIPYTDLGASLVWSRRLFESLPLITGAGTDIHWIDGQSQDTLFDPEEEGVRTGFERSDGKQFFWGLFVHGIYSPTPQWEISLGGRVDLWTNYDGTQNGNNTDPDTQETTTIDEKFGSETRAAFNPRGSVLFKATNWLHLRAAGYRGFRAPTLAELYRRSQVESLVLLPNPNLSPERLNGAEVGVDLPVLDTFELRATGFWNEVDNPIVSIDQEESVCGETGEEEMRASKREEEEEEGGPCRKRVNEGLARTYGAEVDALYEVVPDLFLSGSFLFADGTLVHTAPEDEDLAGTQLAQIPPYTATGAVEYHNPRIISARLEGRFVDDQFEDQEHHDHLGSYFILNASVARQLPFVNGEVFLAGQNLTDREYLVDNGGGIGKIGTPVLVHGGVRLRF